MLTDTKIRNTKPTDKTERLSDSKGLYLLINPNGSKWWRLDYTINTKRKTLSLGTYPKVSLADVRIKAMEAHQRVLILATFAKQPNSKIKPLLKMKNESSKACLF